MRTGSGRRCLLWGGGGASSGGGWHRDVWRSVDGEEWTRAVSLAFLRRAGHGLAVHDGYLWVIGGYGTVNLGDVWRSADGIRWELVTEAAGFSARSDHGAVSHGGSLWVIGGFARVPNRRSRDLNDVWASANGKDWVSVAVSGGQFSARGEHGVASYRGSLWVVGGYDGDAAQDDVWASANGRVWTLVTATAAFSAPSGYEVVAHGGTLWVLGRSGEMADVWYSEGGDGLDGRERGDEVFGAE